MLLLLILWPIAELLVAIKVAGAIGVLLTLILLAAGWPAGLWLMRTQGRSAWRRLQLATASGRPPGREVLDGALILAGGALLIVPGFITDVLGLALLASPTRGLARRSMVRNFQSRFVRHAARFGGRPRGHDVDSTAIDVDPARLPR
ncbi:MAG: FxsA family protein, partial [Actinomycetota bacterium]|nr:FxsA family protein [Actinomycetota bacterium]